MTSTTTETKRRSIGLLPRVLIGIVLGVICGLFFPDWLVRVFVTFNGIFGNFLSFIIPLIIVGLITPAISEFGKAAGRWLLAAVALAYGSTFFAGFMSYGVSMATLPWILGDKTVGDVADPEAGLLTPFFEIAMPPVFEVMTALVLSFAIGVGLAFTGGKVLHEAFANLRDVVNLIIAKVIIPLLPIYIFGIFLNMTAAGQVFSVIVTFLGVVVLVFILTVVLLLVQFAVAGAMTKHNPLRMLKDMLPAYATALGTSSSAATIPVTLRQTKKIGVSDRVASFTVPLFATIHLAGSTTKIVSFAIAVMMLYDQPIGAGLMVGFIMLLGVTMIAAPGVPGGAIMTAAGLLSSMMGFTDAQVGLMIATYIAIDSFGTATNVTGDGALAAIIDSFVKRSGETFDDEVTTPDFVENSAELTGSDAAEA